MIFEDGFMFDYLIIWQWRWSGNDNDDDIWHLAMVTFVTQVSSILRLPLSREHHGQGLQCLVNRQNVIFKKIKYEGHYLSVKYIYHGQGLQCLVNRKTTFCILMLADCEI